MCLLLVVAVEQPALAAERTPSCAGDALTAADQTSALARAAECGNPVEIAAARGYAERQVAEPDGSITLESYLRPRWAKDRNGQWVEADPTLRRNPTGAISTVATVVDLEVSAGGRGALVRATDPAGGSILLTWPAELPEPVLAGATATYPDVFDGVDGVDLQVTAGVDSFSYALVVHSAEAAASPELATVEVGVTGEGLLISQTPDGAVVALGATGEVVFSAVGAYMWDSSSPEPVAQLDSAARDGAGPAARGGDIPDGDPGRLAEVPLELAGDTLRVTPDQSMLSAADTEFPVTIDPTFTASRMAWAAVANGKYADDTWWNDAAWPRLDGLRVGYLGWIPPSELGYDPARLIFHGDYTGGLIESGDVEVKIEGEAVSVPVGVQGLAAAEGEPEIGDGIQGELGDEALERGERHGAGSRLSWPGSGVGLPRTRGRPEAG